MTKFPKFETLLKKLSIGETKIENVCTKISSWVKDATFDQSDTTSSQERLALAFADFTNSQYEVMTLHDYGLDMEEEWTRYGKCEDICDASKQILQRNVKIR